MSLSIEEIVDAWTGRNGDDTDIDPGQIADFLNHFAQASSTIIAVNILIAETEMFSDIDVPPSSGEATASVPSKISAIHAEEHVGSDAARNEEIVKKGFLTKAKKFISRLPKAQDTVAMYFAMLDKSTPLWAKALIAAALAYFILPFDAVTDIIPGVGFLDDASVLAATIAAVSIFINSQHRLRAKEWLDSETPNWKTKKK